MTAAKTPWLKLIYFAALAQQAVIVLMMLVLTVQAGFRGGANAAPDTLLFSIFVSLGLFLPAIPSVVALLSWHMCRRQGAEPSTGHKSLTIALAALWLILMGTYFQV